MRTQALNAYSHQDLPFAKLVKELKPHTSPGCNPLFQAMFILQDAPKAELSCPGLHVSRLAHDMRTAKYDLSVLLSLRQGVEIALEYDSTLFEPSTIAQLLQQFKEVLQEIATDIGGHVKTSMVERLSVPPRSRSQSTSAGAASWSTRMRCCLHWLQSGSVALVPDQLE